MLASGQRVLNMCANNYLGLSSHPAVVQAARAALDTWGYGVSSVRFICGTQALHHELEAALSEFLGTDDAILYSSCFDANGGLFETLLTADDVIVSDALNHASIIDGVRLCKAQRLRYSNADMDELEARLKEASAARVRLIATDGVFSMDGVIAPLAQICDLAERYDALVMVDDSHSVGVLGDSGRGTPEHCGVADRIDIYTGTFGKALGGASGGYTAAHRDIVATLRQRSRPYLFSNSLAPMIAAASLQALRLLSDSHELVHKLHDNTAYFRKGIASLGMTVAGADHPIVPIMLGDARLAKEMAGALLADGVYVVGFSYPVVPKDKARIRVQVSAAHSRDDLDFALEAFARAASRVRSQGGAVRLAERVSRLGTETAFAVSAEAAAYAAAGHTVYPFHIGDMNLATPANIQEAALRAMRDGKTGYCPNGGIAPLREALAAEVSRTHGVTYGADNVAVQPGGKPVIEKFLLNLVDPGEEVLYPSPGFPIYESQIEFLGARAVPYGFRPGPDNFLLDFAAIERAVTARTRAIIVNDLHNPTGAVSPRGELEALADLCLRHDLAVLADEAYWDIRYSGEPLSIAALPGMAERTVILYTFSKKFAMTGWRLGAAIGPQRRDRGDRHAQRQPGKLHQPLRPARRGRGPDRRPVGRGPHSTDAAPSAATWRSPRSTRSPA